MLVLAYLKVSFDLCSSCIDWLILKVVIHWLHLYSVTIIQWFCRIWISHLSCTDIIALIRTTTQQLTTTRKALQDCTNLLSFLRGWQFLLEDCRACHCGSKQRINPTICLNHTVVYKHMNNKELCLTISKYVDKLLAWKSLRVKLKKIRKIWSVLL